MAQTLDFVFQEKLLTLQFDQFQVISGRMSEFLLDLTLKRLVTTLEFSKMGLQCHAIPPLAYDSSVTQRSRGGNGKTAARQK